MSGAGFPAWTATERCLALRTYRRDGTAVTTPVWFVEREGLLVVSTSPSSGKLKRLRHTPRCAVAPCTMRGRVTGEFREATARQLPDDDGRLVEELLRRKYGVQKRLLDVVNGWRSGSAPGQGAYLAVTILDGEPPRPAP